MVADQRDGKGQLPNFHAMATLVLAIRQDPELSAADVWLLLELYSRADLRTGKTRATLRELAGAMHHQHHQAVMRRRDRLEARGWFKREGTARPGYASPDNRETYRLRGDATSPHSPPVRGRPVPSRGDATTPERGDATTPVRERERKRGAASPAPSRRRSGSAAQDPADNGRVQLNDRRWRELPEKSTGLPESVRAMLDQAMREAGLQPGTVHRLRVPGQEGPPLDEASTGTWG